MNETLKAIHSRYSCRAYTAQCPKEEQLQAISDAAIASPSGMNTQNWQIIVVKNHELLAEMEEAAMNVLASLEDKSTYERIVGRGGKVYYNAPVMYLIVQKPTQLSAADCGIVSENISLAAHSLGLGSVICGMASIAFNSPKGAYFKEKCRFPEGMDLGMAVLVGYSALVTEPHQLNRDKITVID